MRSVAEIDEWSTRHPATGAQRAVNLDAYEACIPMDFWLASVDAVTHNKQALEMRIHPYLKSLNRARKSGYGLALFGNNGSGKTYFACIVAMAAVRKRWGVYYTTALQLDHDYRRCWSDKDRLERLEWYLDCDLLVLDELAKEKTRDGDAYGRLHIERILKRRADDCLPTVLCGNGTREDIVSAYGESIDSIVGGKFVVANLKPGDFRKTVNEQVLKDIGAPK